MVEYCKANGSLKMMVKHKKQHDLERLRRKYAEIKENINSRKVRIPASSTSEVQYTQPSRGNDAMEECSSRSTLVDSSIQTNEDYSSRSTLIESSAQTMEECSSRSTLVELSAQINEYEAADVNVVNEWEKELMDDISEEVCNK
jgi:hypothetical protein